jgi:uncharacterized protein
MVGTVRQSDGAMLTDPTVSEMVNRLVKAVGPERIYLFGSRARGDARPDSDYDLLVIVGHRDGAGFSVERRAYDALWGLGGAKDVVVMTREQFDRQLGVAASLAATVAREGRLVFTG